MDIEVGSQLLTEGSDEINEVSLVSVISNSVRAVIFQFQPWLMLKESKQKLYSKYLAEIYVYK